MENPYARAAEGASASNGKQLSADEQRIADYELAVGPNSDYYLPKFELFDQGGSRAGWHWPAFFVTAPWYLYRKMFGYGIVMLIWPWIALTVLAILGAALQPGAAVVLLLTVVLLLGPSALLSVYASSIYHRHVNKIIRSIPGAIAQHPDKRMARIERNGGTGTGVMIGILVGGFFFVMFFVGIIAAISIPAYQDYTIRAQVHEGLNLAAPLKAQISEYYSQRGAWPEQADLQGEMPTSQYVSGMEVQGGSIIIRYGGAANEKIRDQRLVLSPALDMEDNISWICGNGHVAPGVRRADGPYGSELEDKYLPANCRTPR